MSTTSAGVIIPAKPCVDSNLNLASVLEKHLIHFLANFFLQKKDNFSAEI